MMSIKNGDLPAMPIYDMPIDSRSAASWLVGGLCGITKREDIAKHVMAALCVNNSLGWIDEHAAKTAVELTDKLLAELERIK